MFVDNDHYFSALVLSSSDAKPTMLALAALFTL
jgi:hypothetical protein